MWIVYLLQHDVTNQMYIGKTADLQRRFLEHNRNHQRATTRTNGSWLLVYAEAYRNKEDADLREHRLKHHGSGIVELKKRLRASLRVKSGAGCNKRARATVYQKHRSLPSRKATYRG